jgi:hypothetical protein
MAVAAIQPKSSMKGSLLCRWGTDALVCVASMRPLPLGS